MHRASTYRRKFGNDVRAAGSSVSRPLQIHILLYANQQPAAPQLHPTATKTHQSNNFISEKRAGNDASLVLLHHNLNARESIRHMSCALTTQAEGTRLHFQRKTAKEIRQCRDFVVTAAQPKSDARQQRTATTTRATEHIQTQPCQARDGVRQRRQFVPIAVEPVATGTRQLALRTASPIRHARSDGSTFRVRQSHQMALQISGRVAFFGQNELLQRARGSDTRRVHVTGRVSDTRRAPVRLRFNVARCALTSAVD